MFMVVFPFLYITTSQMPKELLPETYATLVAYNPVTYVLEGTRSLMIGGWGDQAIAQGFIVATITFVVMVTLTLISFNKTIK
jgi:ABC-2 type transport system permease protein